MIAHVLNAAPDRTRPYFEAEARRCTSVSWVKFLLNDFVKFVMVSFRVATFYSCMMSRDLCPLSADFLQYLNVHCMFTECSLNVH
jgi:hypothetical protein